MASAKMLETQLSRALSRAVMNSSQDEVLIPKAEPKVSEFPIPVQDSTRQGSESPHNSETSPPKFPKIR